MALSTSTKTWLQELLPRFSAHWQLKTLFIPVSVTGFFIAYFQLLEHPLLPVTVVPLTWLDGWVGFHPFALIPYASLWVYVLLAPAMLRGRRELVVYCSEVAALSLLGLGTFLLWPTTIPAPESIENKNALVALLKNVDAAGNACPSLHVAFAVFTAIWLGRLLRDVNAPLALRLFNAGWCAAIAYSTLATKQHVAVDVFAGTTLGAAAGLFSPRETARSFDQPVRWLSRQSLAFFVSLTGKLTLFSLELEHTHPAMAVVLFLGPDLWILAGLLIPNTSCLLPTATRFHPKKREVWLTIDDGPTAATTLAMLDLLDHHGAKATFFLVGQRAAAHPGLVTEICRRGHGIGNHTQTHPLGAFWLAGPTRTADEVNACQAVLRSSGAPTPTWFRPPAGIKTFFLRSVLARHGMILVGWSARAREHWSTSIDAPLRRLKRKISPGAILLVHESNTHGAERVALLSALLDHLASSGYACVLPKRDDLR